MRTTRLTLAVATVLALALSIAARVYAATTDTSRTTSNANLGKFWSLAWLVFAAGCAILTAFAVLLELIANNRRVGARGTPNNV